MAARADRAAASGRGLLAILLERRADDLGTALREDLVEAVRVLECLLEAGGHHEPENPCLVDSEKGVWNVPGEVDERARLGANRASPRRISIDPLST